MFDNPSVHDTEHVEPCGGVVLIFHTRFRIFANERQRDVLALGLDRDQRRQRVQDLFRTAPKLPEIREEALEAGIRIRVVLNVVLVMKSAA